MTNKWLFISVLVWLFTGCKTEEPDFIPDVFVDIQINLNNIEYLPLQTPGGFITVDGGVRGIIIYRTNTNNYRAFERNCPFKPSEDCSTVSVDGSALFMQCPCCTSQFDFEGSVISGPSPLSLKRYSTNLSGNFLYIRN